MNVVVFAAHPDDETYGCGGVLLRHLKAGDRVHWVIMTEAHAPQWTASEIAQQASQIDVVASAYPMSSLDWYRLPSTRLETVPLVDVMARIRTTVERTRPELVYVPSPWDVHTDHRVTFDAALSVLKPFHMPRLGVRRILAFETPSSTDAAPPLAQRQFLPTVFVDVSAFLERKLEIAGLFASEVQAEPLPRGASAVRALARVRGATVAAEYAEAFMLIRELA